MGAQITRHVERGSGVHSELRLSDGRQVGVAAHETGGFSLTVEAEAGRPATVELTDDEANALACALGSPKLVGQLATVQHDVRGLEIDQLLVPTRSRFVGAPLSETRIHSKTGALVLAVIRVAGAQPMPGSDFKLAAGDTLLTAGTREALDQAAHLLDGTG